MTSPESETTFCQSTAEYEAIFWVSRMTYGYGPMSWKDGWTDVEVEIVFQIINVTFQKKIGVFC